MTKVNIDLTTINVPSTRKEILAEGPAAPVLAIIGDFPGATEEIVGRPFVGSPGELLNTALHKAGLARQECYITNLVKTRPAGDNFSVYWNGTRPTAALIQAKESLLLELERLNCNVLVPLGHEALWALTGQTKIGKWRGSILSCTLPSGRVVKVIPSYHPRSAMKDYSLAPVLAIDLVKAKNDSGFPELNLPIRDLIIRPEINSIIDFCDYIKSGTKVCYDIETTPYNITCIGLGSELDVNKAMCIPTTVEYWGTYQRLHEVLRIINDVLQQPHLLKIGQNITYDIQYLTRFFHILPSKPWADTMIMQHSCYSELPKSLAFLASIYTRQPYYKDDLKIWMGSSTPNDELLWKYNATDICTTLEVEAALQKQMSELEVRHTYDYMMELLEPLLFMMLKGIRVDHAAIAAHKAALNEELVSQKEIFKTMFGDVNLRSPKQLKEFVKSSGLSVPVIKGKETMNAKAIEKLAKVSPGFESITEIKQKEKLIDGNLSIPLDAVDGYLKFSINSTGAETGRLSSSSSVFGCGDNMQNQPKKVRNIYIPDEGLVITAADEKGAEAMVVAYESNDPVLIKLYEEGANIHNYTARIAFGQHITDEMISADKLKHKGKVGVHSIYDKAKRIRHGGNYLASWVSVKETLGVTAAEAKQILQNFYDGSPNLVHWHREIINTLRRDNGWLTTPLGRKRRFFGRWGNDLLREAVAYIPQETVAHVINLIIIKFYNEVCKKHKHIFVNLQVHDEVVTQHPPELTSFVHSELHRISKTIMLKAHDKEYYIPLEIKTGLNWRDTKEVECQGDVARIC